MKIFELANARVKYFVVAEDEEGAYKQGTDPEQFPDMHYTPFEIKEVIVPGYTITVTPDEAPKNKGGRPARTKE